MLCVTYYRCAFKLIFLFVIECFWGDTCRSRDKYLFFRSHKGLNGIEESIYARASITNFNSSISDPGSSFSKDGRLATSLTDSFFTRAETVTFCGANCPSLLIVHTFLQKIKNTDHGHAYKIHSLSRV